MQGLSALGWMAGGHDGELMQGWVGWLGNVMDK